MEIYFTDRKFSILGMASTRLPNVLFLYDDNEGFKIDDGGSQFEGTVEYNVKRGIDTKGIVEVGNFILFEDEEGKSQWYTIMTTELNVKASTLSFTCESAGLDLLNEITPAYKADKAYNIAFYMNRFMFDSGFTININEVSNLTRTLEWTGEDTATKRLLSVANYFDGAEIDFSFRIEKMQLTGKYLNIYKKRGNNTNINLRMGHDVDNIVSTASIENLFTALEATGGTPEGSETPINLRGYIYNDGRFKVDEPTGIVLDMVSNRKWSRYITNPVSSPNGAGYILARKSDYTTLDKATLVRSCVSFLTKASQIEQTWDVDIIKLPDGLRLGDTVNVIDEDDEIYLSSRILELNKSRSEDKTTAVLGEFAVQGSGIRQEVRDLADKVASIPKGDTFYPWVRYADDANGNGFSPNPIGKTYMAIVYGKNNPTPSENPADYTGKWVKIQGGQGAPGLDGKPTYTWVKYADNVAGGGMSDSPSGKKYIGIGANKSTETPSTDPLEYKWSLIQGDTTYFYQAWADDSVGSVGFSITVSLGKKFMGTYSSTNPIQSTQASSYKWNSTANNVEVGGVNLFDYTNPMRNFSLYLGTVATYTQGVSVPAWKATTATTITTTGGTNGLKIVKGSTISPSVLNQAYMFTGYIRNNMTTTLSLTFNSLASTITIPAGSTQFLKVPMLGNGVSNAQVGFQTISPETNLDVTLWHFQLEAGNVATDYRPATVESERTTTELSEKVSSVTYPIVSPTQPTIGLEGQQWWQTDDNNDVVGYFVYRIGQTPPWVPQTLQQGILNVTDLNAVKITGSEITGTTVTGSTVTNTFDNKVGTLRYVGEMKMDKSIFSFTTDVLANGVLNAKSKFLIDPMSVMNNITNAAGAFTSSFILTASGLDLSSANGSLSYGIEGIFYKQPNSNRGLQFLYGSEGLQIKPYGLTSNASMEIFGKTPYIDFHSNGWSTNDYDNRIISSNGNGKDGNGTLTFNGWYHSFITPTAGSPGIRITSASLQSINSQDIRLTPGGFGSALIIDQEGNWRPIKASAFNVNSDRDSKKNIETVENFADKLRGVKVYNYNLKSDYDWELKNTGMMMQEVPVELISPAGAIDIYSVGSMSIGLGLENLEKIEKLEEDNLALRSEMEEMKEQMKMILESLGK